jgi:DNA-binding Lrp family transcriptional regulator
VVRRLLQQGPQPLGDLAAALGLTEDETAVIVALLRRDGLVTESGGTVSIA